MVKINVVEINSLIRVRDGVVSFFELILDYVGLEVFGRLGRGILIAIGK